MTIKEFEGKYWPSGLQTKEDILADPVCPHSDTRWLRQLNIWTEGPGIAGQVKALPAITVDRNLIQLPMVQKRDRGYETYLVVRGPQAGMLGQMDQGIVNLLRPLRQIIGNPDLSYYRTKDALEKGFRRGVITSAPTLQRGLDYVDYVCIMLEAARIGADTASIRNLASAFEEKLAGLPERR